MPELTPDHLTFPNDLGEPIPYHLYGRPGFLMFHGDRSSPSSQSELAGLVRRELGGLVMVPSYSGQYDESPTPIEQTTVTMHIRDAEIAYDLLRDKVGTSSEMVAIGISYGAFLAASLATTRQVDRLVLRAPVLLPPEMQELTWEERQAHKDVINAYRNNRRLIDDHPFWDSVEGLEVPTLVMIHQNDNEVPSPLTTAFAERMGAETYTAEGFLHSIGQTIFQGLVDGLAIEAYNRRIIEFCRV